MKSGIERISMDGAPFTRQVLISSKIGWPNGLTLDLRLQHMYWVDARFNRIEMSNLDGSGRKLVKKTGKQFQLIRGWVVLILYIGPDGAK